MTETEKLIERLEAATGPDRELDGLMYGWESGLSPNGGSFMLGGGFQFRHPTKVHPSGPAALYVPGDSVPAYTASLDAALALVERVRPGWWWCSRSDDTEGAYANLGPARTNPNAGGPCWRAYAPTAPIALCLALLRTLETSHD